MAWGLGLAPAHFRLRKIVRLHIDAILVGLHIHKAKRLHFIAILSILWEILTMI